MNCTTSNVIFLFSILFLIKINSAVILKFTGINCQAQEGDNKFADFEYCYLKAIRRDYVEAFVKVRFYQLPVTEAKGRIRVWKRANGFKPFLYNIKFDACKLFNNANYHISIEKFLFDLVTDVTNIKLGCPWNISHFTADHFAITPKMFKLPIPSGTYRADCILTSNGIQRLLLNVTVVKEE